MNGAILVFGGAGFIGTHLLRRLAENAFGPLISVDRADPKNRVPCVTYICADVRDLNDLLVARPITRIYNLAAVHRTPGHDEHEYYQTNILGAAEITAFARKMNVRSIVFTSSISVYGPGEDTKIETTTPAPNSAYGWSKLLAERIHRNWHAENSERQLVIVRPAVIFGPGEGGNFTRLAQLLRRGLFIYPGRRDTVKACFHVDHLIDAIAYAVASDERFVLFNGCYPDHFTLEDIVETFRRNYFPNAHTYMIPRAAVLAAAIALRPFSGSKLGIHPDRVMKLVHSTNIEPRWLGDRGFAKQGLLSSALARWAEASDRQFT